MCQARPCSGVGPVKVVPCPRCGGSGEVDVRTLLSQPSQVTAGHMVTCATCGGHGSVPAREQKPSDKGDL